jgi:glycosyltransferase involved in cell wall biosynthesis
MSLRAATADNSSPLCRYPIGVVVPTYNRSEALLTCLNHLEQQTMCDFEVVVVDDGSTDSTPVLLEEYKRKTSLHFRFFRQDNSGPARARNLGISVLHSPICVMIGDDIFPSQDFVSAHLKLHQQKPGKQVAGLGLTRWSDSGQTVTPFMRWLDEGVQFAYKDLLQGLRPSWKHFYTSNLSVKTQLLRENPFDESFKRAAAEDIELGYRIHRRLGLEIAFIPEALAHHLHPTNFRQACKRNISVGESMRRFHELWPDSISPDKKSLLRRSLRAFMLKNLWLLPSLTVLAEAATNITCPNPLMRGVLNYYYQRGYQGIPCPDRKTRSTSQ